MLFILILLPNLILTYHIVKSVYYSFFEINIYLNTKVIQFYSQLNGKFHNEMKIKLPRGVI